MRKVFTPKVFVIFALVLGVSAVAFGQEPQPEDIRQGDGPGAVRPKRPSLLEELGLSPEQVSAVRRLNQERKPVENAAHRRFQNAQRDLNLAIYSDYVDDADVQAKLSEFQAAQAELARIKFMNELAVRKVLTPAQLTRFRELRRQFAEVMRDQRPKRPLQRMRRRGLPIH